jgi:hypothetical protein
MLNWSEKKVLLTESASRTRPINPTAWHVPRSYALENNTPAPSMFMFSSKQNKK